MQAQTHDKVRYVSQSKAKLRILLTLIILIHAECAFVPTYLLFNWIRL